jgi:hypothetical protein
VARHANGQFFVWHPLSVAHLMKTRNLYRNRHGTIDMEIEHPVYGWIPFTASPDDSEPHGRALYAEAASGALGKLEEPQWPDVPDVPAAPSAEEIFTAIAERDAGNTKSWTALSERMKLRHSALQECAECERKESGIRASLASREPYHRESSVKIGAPQ